MALTQTQVSELYVAIFNRASEGAGNKYWQSQGDLAEVANKMLGTADAKAYFGDSLNDDKAFVEWIYKNTFNKTYADDPKGIDHWVEDLANGATRGEVVANIVTAATDPANAGDAQDQFMNRVTVSNYLAEHFAGEKLATTMPDYKTELGFDGDLKVTKDGQTVADAEHLIESKFSDGKTITLTTGIDKGPDFAGTDSSDTWIATSSTLGQADALSDPSIKDNDHLKITAKGNIPGFTAVNIENIDVKFDTLGGNSFNAIGVSDGGEGSVITVSSDKFGFSGAATIRNLASNKAVAGQNITNLTVNGITNGTIDAGKAQTVTAYVYSQNGNSATAGVESLNLITNGNVTLKGLNTTGDLNIESKANSVVDVTNITFNNSDIKGSANVTIKSDSDEVDGETIKNSGKGTVTLELTDSNSSKDTSGVGAKGTNDVDMRKMDIDNVILDKKYTQELIFNKALNVTAEKAGNTATFSAPNGAGLGGSTAAELTLNLTQAADGTDTYTMNKIGQTELNVQKGGTINTITDKDGSVDLKAGDDTTVKTADLSGQALSIDGKSAGKVTLSSIKAQAIIANDFTKDLNITETDNADENIAIVGSKAKNYVKLATATKTVSIKTQDSKDTINADSITTGKLTIDTAGGDDTVSAQKMTTGKATIDLGAGKDAATVTNIKDGVATVNGGDGDDTITVLKDTAGKMTLNGGAGNDTINLANVAGGELKDTANITVNGGAGNDVINNDNISSKATITIDGGDGNDIFDVMENSDYTNAHLTMNNLETLKIDQYATFSGSQLNGQKFTVMSGTSGTDILNVKLAKTDATATLKTTDLGKLDMSTKSANKIEYVVIDASKSAGSDKIVGVHNSANVIDITDADGTATNPIKNTIQLFADSIGNTIDNLQSGSTQPDVKTSMLQDPKANKTKVSFDIAVITGFQSSKVNDKNKVVSDDSLILGDAATSTNFKSVAVKDAFDGSKANKAGMEEYLANALKEANVQMGAHHDLEYVYVYDGHTTTANPKTQDAWLMWDSDGDHKADAAILLVGVEPKDGADGSGFAASDIIAAS